ncbi:hypothetical protein [Carboxydocella sp. JDF658]|uniref:hypothetical protein n=1 Tax=Carboxydocella sp. JDF658 TaxID=1926600 RepID=UPI0009AD6B3C|nr:hypothetical protein [Carboxydocella sp. JDF658]
MRNRVVIAYWTGAGLMAGEPVLSRAGSREWKRLWLEQVAAQGLGAEILPHLVACVAWPQGSGVPLIGAGALATVAEGCQGWWRQQPEADEALTWLGQTLLKQILNQYGEEIPYLLWLQHPGGPPAYQLARLTALAGLAVAPGGLLAWEQAVLLLNPDLLLPAIQQDSCWYWIWDDSGLLGLRWQQLDGCWQVTTREFWPEFGGQQLEQEVSSRMGWHLARSHCWLQEPAAAGWWERKIKSGLELIRPRLQGEELLLVGDNWNRGGQLPALTDEQWLQNLMLGVFDRWQEQQTLP